MCGGFSLEVTTGQLKGYYEIELAPTDITPRYNIRPGQNVVAIRQDKDSGARFADRLKWGLIPSWAKDEKIAYKTINARSETVDQKPSYRSAFKRRRCLIPATGFFEWKKVEGGKQPYNIRLKSGGIFSIAGLWERWEKGPAGALETFTILTTTPNPLVAEIHDRMPVILPKDIHGDWLNPAIEGKTLKDLLVPYPADQMELWPVTTLVGNSRVDEPGLTEPLRDLFGQVE